MPKYKIIPEEEVSQTVTDTFGGYNHNLRTNDGEWYDMDNISGRHYPLFASRPPRGIVKGLTRPGGLTAKKELVWIEGSQLYYGGEDITSRLTEAGAALTAGEHQIVSMGAYIIILPERVYLNTSDFTDCGKIDNSITTVRNAAVRYTLCKIDGTEYQTPTVGKAPPEEPEEGDLWIDTTGDTHWLKQWNNVSKEWITIPTVYVKISYLGIGKGFKQYDGVKITGINESTGDVNGDGTVDNQDLIDLVKYVEGRSSDINVAGADFDGDGDVDNADMIQLVEHMVDMIKMPIKKQAAALNGDKIIYAKDDNFIVIVGLIDEAFVQQGGSVTVSRSMPEMDFVVEAENRLWGCKYGTVEGKPVNEIYASALGDFKNWRQFLGTAADSYSASVGTDGEWTGAITFMGRPTFFKENTMHTVYVDSGGAHRITDKACRGVQKGSGASLAIAGELLYYKSGTGVMRYDGSLPILISDKLGDIRYSNASAGALGDKYYISMEQDGKWSFFVYDRGMWFREDDTEAAYFTAFGDELYFIDKKSNRLMAENCTAGLPEQPVQWYAETGIIGYDTVEQKYVGRIALRMMLPAGAKADVYLEYDSDGQWQHTGHIEGTGTRTFTLPVRPRRCDHFRLKIEGQGDTKIYSIAKIYESGGDKLW